MIDFSLGYESDGEHHGLGVGLSKPPDSFTVREHLEDGTYIEAVYAPKRTCKNLHPDPDKGFICSECSALIRDNCVGKSCVDNDGVRWYSTSTMHNFNRCPNCGAEVVDEA